MAEANVGWGLDSEEEATVVEEAGMVEVPDTVKMPDGREDDVKISELGLDVVKEISRLGD